MTEPERQRFEFGPFLLDPRERLLSREGKPVSITPTGFEILTLLVRNSGHLVEKEVMLREVWPDTFVEEANLSVHISALRRALGESAEEHSYIETVPRRGYRFVAPVREAAAATIVVQDHVTSRITIEEKELITEGTWPSLRPLRATLIVGAAVVAIGVVVLALFAWAREEKPLHRRPKIGAVKLAGVTSSGNAVNAAISPDGRFLAVVVAEASGAGLWLRNVRTHGSVPIVPPAEVEYLGLSFSRAGNDLFFAVRENNTLFGSLFQMPVPAGQPRKIFDGLSRAFSLSPDDRLVAFIRDNRDEGTSHLIIGNLQDGRERVLVERKMSERSWSPAWSPDGRSIAVVTGSNDAAGRHAEVVTVNPDDGRQRVLSRGRWADVIYLAWTGDGKGLFMTARVDAERVFQIWRIDVQTGASAKVTNDLNSYWHLSSATESNLLAAIQLKRHSNIWVAPPVEPSRAVPVTSGSGRYHGLSWTPAGSIVYAADTQGYHDLWVVNADGTNPKRLTADQHSDLAPTVSPDGRFIVFASDRSGIMQLWRMNSEGANLVQLTHAPSGAYRGSFTPDGRWIVYHGGTSESLWKVSIEGGEPLQLTSGGSLRPAVSPDGERIAFFHRDRSGTHLATIPIEGGQIRTVADITAGVNQRAGVAWSSDGSAILYVDSRGGVSNIWSQPLDGGPASQVTTFTAENIFSFALTSDGKSLACSRGLATSDVVLISWELTP